MDNLALCELLSEDVASLVGVNFGSKSYVSCSYCSYFVLVDLDLVLFRSTFSCCCACVDHLQVAPRHKAELLIQIGFCISASNLYFCQIHLLSEVPVQCRKFRSIGTSYTASEVLTLLTASKNFSVLQVRRFTRNWIT